jgi:hypothetical protein
MCFKKEALHLCNFFSLMRSAFSQSAYWRTIDDRRRLIEENFSDLVIIKNCGVTLYLVIWLWTQFYTIIEMPQSTVEADERQRYRGYRQKNNQSDGQFK